MRLATGQTGVVPPDRVKEKLEIWADFMAAQPDRMPPGSRIDLTGDGNYPVTLPER